MKNFLRDLGYRLNGFMQGRYGSDELNHGIFILALVSMVVSLFRRLLPALTYFSFLSTILLIVYIFRAFSRNIYKRTQENSAYLRLFSSFSKTVSRYKGMWRDRNTHKYYKCPVCKSYVRIRKPPKGKNIAVRCTKCHNEFTKRT